MMAERNPIDISGIPELVRVVEEVRESGSTQVLHLDGRPVAEIQPLSPRHVSEMDAEEIEAFIAQLDKNREERTNGQILFLDTTALIRRARAARARQQRRLHRLHKRFSGSRNANRD